MTRDECIASMRARVNSFEATADPRHVFGSDVDAEKDILWDLAFGHDDQTEVDYAAAQVLAWLFWYRYEVDRQEESLELAFQLFWRLCWIGQEQMRHRLPAQLGPFMPWGRPFADQPDPTAECQRLLELMIDAESAQGDQWVAAMVALYRAALDLLPPHDEEHFPALTTLASALDERFALMATADDLHDSIEAYRTARQEIPADYAMGPQLEYRLAKALLTRFEELDGSIDDVEEAITVSRAALNHRPDDADLRHRLLITLTWALQAWSKRTGNGLDLDEMAELTGQAVEATPTGDPNRIVALMNHGNTFESR